MEAGTSARDSGEVERLKSQMDGGGLASYQSSHVLEDQETRTEQVG